MLKRALYLLLFVICLAVGFLFYLRIKNTSKVDTTKTVYLSQGKDGPQLFRNGKPFYIKGASGRSHIKELAEIGGNTLRVYDTTNIQGVLDEAYKHNIAVIVDIPIPPYSPKYHYYDSKTFTDSMEVEVRSLVNRIKDHPALLFWSLGNEVDFPLVFFKNRFIKTYNNLIDIIHELDPNHPVSTTICSTTKTQILGIYLYAHNIDLMGFNVFGSLPDVDPIVSKFSYLLNLKPYFFSEWGIHGPWEEDRNTWESLVELNSTEKAKVYTDLYKSYIEPDKNALGSLVFYWGDKVEGTPTWFNIFNEEGRTSETFYSLKSVWTKQESKDSIPPQILDLELNGNGKFTNHIYKPNHIGKAELNLGAHQNSDLKFKWVLCKEGWGDQEEKFDSLYNNPILIKSIPGSKIEFKMPEEEGPYRLFVNVYDKQNNFSTANVPFYILN
ncbi:glycoside hydrolase family 2 TIM barrel-domain containing protein [Formosa sp. S-31]|uniref:glycoside hydrolase family 2 TIM barrel-domain containing protein n=1 Tax=Formosa sp. S-31 TaxID=2790949 RepID=UPI003EBFCE34